MKVGSVLRNKVWLLLTLPMLAFFFSLLLGRYPVSILDVAQILLAKLVPLQQSWPNAAETVVLQIRIPRTVLALLVGAGLSVSGTAFQGMFQNPLVSPEILGVSAGAGFGAALAILISGNPMVIQISAFFFGILAVVMAYLMGRIFQTTPVLTLVLSGVIVGSFFSALISLATYVADPYSKLPRIVFWLMGGLSATSTHDVASVALPILLGVTGLLLLRWQMNVLAMGDEEARSLGVNTEVLKVAIIVCATITTASAVSVSGIIGWVGLVVPHISRMIVGPDHRKLLPASVAIGSAYLLLIDILARTATSAEIPLGILTAVIGTPFFAYLLRNTKGGWL